MKTGKILWTQKLATGSGFRLHSRSAAIHHRDNGSWRRKPLAGSDTITPEINPPATGFAMYVYALPDKK